MLAVALTRNELLDERSVTRAPTDRQSTPDLTLDPLDLLVELTSGKTLDRTGRDGVHGRELEEANGLVNVVRLNDGRESDLGYRLGDSDDGLQLSAGRGWSASVEVWSPRLASDATYRTVMGIELRSSLSLSTC